MDLQTEPETASKAEPLELGLESEETGRYFYPHSAARKEESLLPPAPGPEQNHECIPL